MGKNLQVCRNIVLLAVLEAVLSINEVRSKSAGQFQLVAAPHFLGGILLPLINTLNQMCACLSDDRRQVTGDT